MTVENTDIIIIGGGLLGAATAYQLACRTSKNILLLERHDIASQATSRAACLLTRARTKPVLMQMVQETYDCIDRIETELGETLDIQQVGSVTVATSPDNLENLKQLEVAATNFNIQNEWITRSKVQELLPWMRTDDILGALYMPTDAYIDSAQLCNGYVKAAKNRGVTFRTRTNVKELIVENKHIIGVRLSNDDEIHAPIVINAAGSWANILSYPHGDGLPMTPVRSHFWISESNEVQFPKNEPFTILPDARAFTRPDVGALIIGIREPECVAYNPATFPDNIDQVEWSKDNGWSTLASSSKEFAKFYPQINDLGIAHYVAGPSCYVPDAMFVIGKSEKTDGLFNATGCCGGGVAASGGIGRLVAEQVLNESSFVDASYFNPMRFGEINPFDEMFQLQCSMARSNKKGG